MTLSLPVSTRPTVIRRPHAWRTGFLGAVVALFPLTGWPANTYPDGEEKRAPEVEVQFPSFPQAENLIPFAVSATTDNKFMIDSESLSLREDGIRRYTLVIVSPSGAENVSYEGMNCSTGERRIYALGRSDKTWSKARSDQWMKIRDNMLNRHHAELYTEYFCPIGITMRDADDLRRTLRRGASALNFRK